MAIKTSHNPEKGEVKAQAWLTQDYLLDKSTGGGE
jgi:hypothetical protein